MRVLGIDCGVERTGYGVIESDGRTHTLVGAGVIRTSPKAALEARLLLIAEGLREAIRQYSPAAAAVEEVFHAVNTKTAMKLAHVRGIALLVGAEAGLAMGEYSPLEVKSSVVGYGRAEKHQVQLMVKSLMGLDRVIASEDACDAVAAVQSAMPITNRPEGASRESPRETGGASGGLRRAVREAEPQLFFSKSFPGELACFRRDLPSNKVGRGGSTKRPSGRRQSAQIQALK